MKKEQEEDRFEVFKQHLYYLCLTVLINLEVKLFAILVLSGLLHKMRENSQGSPLIRDKI